MHPFDAADLRDRQIEAYDREIESIMDWWDCTWAEAVEIHRQEQDGCDD